MEPGLVGFQHVGRFRTEERMRVSRFESRVLSPVIILKFGEPGVLNVYRIPLQIAGFPLAAFLGQKFSFHLPTITVGDWDPSHRRRLLGAAAAAASPSEKEDRGSQAMGGDNDDDEIWKATSKDGGDPNQNVPNPVGDTTHNTTNNTPSSSFTVRGGVVVATSTVVHGNLMHCHPHQLDPMQYYAVCSVLGEGSMGYVAKVVKKDSVRGGSARPAFVHQHQQFQNHDSGGNGGSYVCCWHFCTWLQQQQQQQHLTNTNNENENSNKNAVRVPEYQYTKTINNNNNFLDVGTSSSFSSTVDNDTPPYTSSSSSTNSSPFLKRSSSMITYGKKKESHFALKSILLDRCSTPEFMEELKNEVEILKHLDHPNIVRALETFDHHHRVFIVLELCSGGDLYTRAPYTEDVACNIVTSLCKALHYIHSKGIVHRDLKFENIMFVDESPAAEVKIIDFGLSQKFAADEFLHDTVGTVSSMAPELIGGHYDFKVDIWSLGVCTFMLLSSSMPFFGNDRASIVEKIVSGQYSFVGPRWQNVSDDAKRFVHKLLRRRPTKRPTAEGALQLRWLNQVVSSDRVVSNFEQMDTIQGTMQAFAKYPTLKKLALMVVAHKSTSEEIGFLRSMFNRFDNDNDGEITLEEFRESLMEHYDYSDEEIETMFRGIDIDGTGLVHYIEFLAATIEAHGSIDEERLAEAFDRLDSNDSGAITVKNLKDFLGDELSDTYLENILDEVHGTHDHLITYQEFLGLWNSDADEDLATARLNVGCRRLSRTSLASSFSDVDDLGETYQRIAGNDATKPLTSASRTGSFYYMANRDTSMMKAVAHDADAFIL